MNPNPPPNRWKASWPGAGPAFLRFALIALVLLPFVWTVNALLVGGWNLISGPEQSVKHQIQAIVTWLAVSGVMVWLSLLPRFQWLGNRGTARRVLLGFFWTATLVALFYAEENWRGQRAWNEVRKKLETEGAPVDFQTLIPQPIPDDRNFAAIPLIQSWFAKQRTRDGWADAYTKAFPFVKLSSTGQRQFIVAAWATAFETSRADGAGALKPAEPDGRTVAAAQTVLEALQTNSATLAELHTASGRPQSRYPIDYKLEDPWGIVLPHLSQIRHAAQRLELRACAELAAGQNAAALDDVKLILKLADSLRDEPILISHLVRAHCLHLAVQPVWEGLAEQRWTDPELQDLQKQFQQFDFASDLKRSLDAERAASILTADLMAAGKYRFHQLASPIQNKPADVLTGMIPDGWYQFEKVTYCRYFEQVLQHAVNWQDKTFSPGRAHADSLAFVQAIDCDNTNAVRRILRHDFLASLLLPALTKTVERGARAQVAADQAALACALERNRLARGQFPETLDQLVPDFIRHVPRDPIGGGSYKYRRTDNVRFVLYSVGWNEADDGGGPGKTLFDLKTGDWLWSYPEK